MSSIRDNLKRVQDQIANKLSELGRPAGSVTLVAVTKTHPVESVEEALRCGVSHIGENKVQEALRKVPLLREPYAGFHFIGHLQSNKINNLLSLKPTLIHSVDSLYIARELNAALGRKNLTQDILIQVNTTGEVSKTGINPRNTEEMLWQIAALPCLRVKGLMTIGLLSLDPERLRPYFRQLKELFDCFTGQEIPGVEMAHLSMGMSGDYLVALEEGSNLLRLGTALFGAREYGEKH